LFCERVVPFLMGDYNFLAAFLIIHKLSTGFVREKFAVGFVCVWEFVCVGQGKFMREKVK
jgi:hypothetical protein